MRMWTPLTAPITSCSSFADLLLFQDIGQKDLRLVAQILHRSFHSVQLLDVARATAQFVGEERWRIRDDVENLGLRCPICGEEVQFESTNGNPYPRAFCRHIVIRYDDTYTPALRRASQYWGKLALTRELLARTLRIQRYGGFHASDG